MTILAPYWCLDGIVILTFLLIAAYLYSTRKFKYWVKRGVQEIPPTPFLGNFKDCLFHKLSAPYFVKDLYDNGEGLPYVGFYILDKPCLLVRDPELVKHILVKDFNVFSNRHSSPDVTDRIGYANAFMMKTPGWKVIRSKLTPFFTPGKLKEKFESMIMIADQLDLYLEKQDLGRGKIMEMKGLSDNFTTDITTRNMFSVQANSMHDHNSPFRHYGNRIFDCSIFRDIELLIIFFMPHLTKYTSVKFFGKKTNNFLRTVFWQGINDRMTTKEKKNDLIDLLMKLNEKYGDREEYEGFKFSGDDLVAQAAVFFSAGYNTSATTMSFTLYELALNTDVQQTLRKEILQALHETGGKVNYDMITTLPYLDMVISETLRKYPPIGFLDRVASANYEVPNSSLVIEKGTPVYISVTGMHYDPEYFPDPMKFDPLRFSEEGKKSRPTGTYFPFGDGPRTCMGFRLGIMQAKLGIIQMIRKYEVSPCEKTKIPMIIDPKGVITTALGGIHLNIQKIDTDAD